MEKIGDGLYTGAVWYGKFQTIGLIIIGILGLVSFIYGIKLYFTNESNWVPINVIINKIDSIDNKSCNKDTRTVSDKKGSTTSNIYNCTIHFNYNNREIIKIINNSNINYTLNQTIVAYYDKNNPNNDPVINMIFMSNYWWMFILGGIIAMLIGFILTYLILSNDNAAAVYGTGSIVESVFD